VTVVRLSTLQLVSAYFLSISLDPLYTVSTTAKNQRLVSKTPYYVSSRSFIYPTLPELLSITYIRVMSRKIFLNGKLQ